MTRSPSARPLVVSLLVGRRRTLLACGAILAAVVVVVVVVLGDGRGGYATLAGSSPPLPSTYRPGVGIGPVSLGDSRPAVIAALGGPGRTVRGSLVFDRPGGQLAVGFDRGRVVRLLATGRRDPPFGQRLASEETTLSGWTIELCRKPAHLLLVAPDGHTFFVFATAVAGLGAVGVSTARVRPCGRLG